MFDILRCVTILNGMSLQVEPIKFASEEEPPTACWSGLGEVKK
jgi:hypothetical protein